MSKPKLRSTVWFVFAFLLSCFPAFSQSIHQIEYEAHQSIPKQPSLYLDTEYSLLPFNKKSSSGLSSTVFGYLPDWEYLNARSYLQYDLLSHIAAFDFSVSAQGDISFPSYWPWVDVINAAHENGVKMIMTVVNFNTSQLHTLLSSESNKLRFFEQTKGIIEEYELQGVNIDFEGLTSADRGSLLNEFMNDLSVYLHREIPGSEVSFAAPPVNWGGWDLAGLAASCDYLFIMGYNFYGSWSETSGPSAPLRGGSYTITKTVEDQYGAVTSANPEKLILGVPYYGDRWQTRTASAYSATIDHLGHPRYVTAYDESLEYGLKWDFRSLASWYSYKEDNKNYQVWFETDRSLGLKYDLAEKHRLKGVGMWALGYDRHRTELWDELRKRYLETSSDLQFTSSPIGSVKVYPNPVTSLGNIELEVPADGEIKVVLRDASGSSVRNLFHGRVGKGEQILSWTVEDLASGIYFIQVESSSFVKFYNVSKKVLVLK